MRVEGWPIMKVIAKESTRVRREATKLRGG